MRHYYLPLLSVLYQVTLHVQSTDILKAFSYLFANITEAQLYLHGSQGLPNGVAMRHHNSMHHRLPYDPQPNVIGPAQSNDWHNIQPHASNLPLFVNEYTGGADYDLHEHNNDGHMSARTIAKAPRSKTERGCRVDPSCNAMFILRFGELTMCLELFCTITHFPSTLCAFVLLYNRLPTSLRARS